MSEKEIIEKLKVLDSLLSKTFINENVRKIIEIKLIELLQY